VFESNAIVRYIARRYGRGTLQPRGSVMQLADVELPEGGDRTRAISRGRAQVGSVAPMLCEQVAGKRSRQLEEIAAMERLTKEEIMAFARTHYTDTNAAVVYKRTGELDAPQVEKPEISTIELNREVNSPFHEQLLAREVAPVEPVFIDYEEEIIKRPLGEYGELFHVENELNDLFTLSFVIEKGRNGDPELALAAQYLEYLGAGEMTPEQFKQELFRLGCDFGISTGTDRTYITVSGLSDNMEQALGLVIERLTAPAADEQALDALKQRILTARSNDKQNEAAVRSRLNSYVIYGAPNSQMKDFLPEPELAALEKKR
jgi:hypothetical protein